MGSSQLAEISSRLHTCPRGSIKIGPSCSGLGPFLTLGVDVPGLDSVGFPYCAVFSGFGVGPCS